MRPFWHKKFFSERIYTKMVDSVILFIWVMKMKIHNYIINCQQSNNDAPWLEYIYIKDAANNLNGAAFKLFIYFSSLMSEEIIFSPSNYAQEFGGGITSARRAFGELIEAGYLVEQEDNRFIFIRDRTKMV